MRILIRRCVYWVTNFHAARAAAMLRRDPGVDVGLESGPYGSFEVRSDDGTVLVDGGALALMGVLPPLTEIRARVAEKMGAAP